MTPEVRKRVIAEWRGLFEPTTPPDRTKLVSDLIPKLMASLGLSERLNESQIQSAWREVVGDFLADHSAPSRIRNGVLYVQVIQPTVRFELERHWKPQLVRKLKQRFGGSVIKDVKFVVG